MVGGAGKRVVVQPSRMLLKRHRRLWLGRTWGSPWQASPSPPAQPHKSTLPFPSTGTSSCPTAPLRLTRACAMLLLGLLTPQGHAVFVLGSHSLPLSQLCPLAAPESLPRRHTPFSPPGSLVSSGLWWFLRLSLSWVSGLDGCEAHCSGALWDGSDALLHVRHA